MHIRLIVDLDMRSDDEDPNVIAAIAAESLESRLFYDVKFNGVRVSGCPASMKDQDAIR